MFGINQFNADTLRMFLSGIFNQDFIPHKTKLLRNASRFHTNYQLKCAINHGDLIYWRFSGG